MQPTPSLDRLPLLDALRGFALCGILLANLLSFTGAVYITVNDLQKEDWVTRSVLFAIDFFIEGKFYTLFSMMFGIGCAIQWQRHSSQRSRFLSLWYRRMATLLIIGLVHMVFVWYGDILTLYACLGLLLPLLIRIDRDNMLRLIIVLLVLPLVMFTIRYYTINASFWQLSASAATRLHQSWGLDGMNRIVMSTSDNTLTVLQSNITGALQRPMSYFQTGRLFKVLGQFLLGFWIGRYLLPLIRQGWKPGRRVMLLFAVIAVSSNVIYAWIKNTYASPFMLTPIGGLQSIAYHLGSTTMTICYIIAISFIWQRSVNQGCFNPLILLGRMSLSNYLGQSVIGVTVFYGYGFALMGQVPFKFVPLIALSILFIQWQLSKFWLRYQSHGPMETLWRWCTYLHTPITPNARGKD